MKRLFALWLLASWVFVAHCDEGIASPPRVAIYDGAGASQSRLVLVKALTALGDARFATITVKEIQDGGLANYDVLVMPGGSGSGQAKALGESGREQVRNFVRDGGGYLGVCAGAYLATNDYSWSLHILDAKVIDKAHWARGVGDVEITITERGRQLLAVKSERLTLRYHQGPLLAPAADPKVPDYESLAAFAGEVAENGAPRGVMKGTTAAAAGSYGKGRVLCFSPHPERHEELWGLLHRSILWVAGETPTGRQP